MERYAQLSGNLVQNVIESASDPDGTNGEWIACGDAGPGWLYNAQTGVFSAPAAASEQRHLAPASFKRRLTQPERIGIRQAAKVSDEVYDFMDLLDTSKFIDLDDPLTQYGLQQLEAAGLLAAGRAAEILTAPVQESERP